MRSVPEIRRGPSRDVRKAALEDRSDGMRVSYGVRAQMTSTTWLARIVPLGTVALALGLLGIAGHAALLPADAATVYGVPTSGPGLTWVRATGLRDAALGLVVLGTLWHEAARTMVLACALLLPLADTVLAFQQGGLGATLPHAAGVVAIGALLALAMVQARLR